MSKVITSAFPANLYEAGYAKAAREQRPWYLVHRHSTDEIGITAEPDKGDEVMSVYEE